MLGRLAMMALMLMSAGPALAQVAAPTTAGGFFNLFQAKNDWTWSGGDQVTSFKASNGLTYWSFGDTIQGTEDATTGAYVAGWRMIGNSLLVQRGGQLGAAISGIAVPDASDGDRYWTQGMFEANGALYVLCQRVRNTPDGWFELRGVELAKFAFNTDGTLRRVGLFSTPSSGRSGGNSAAATQYAADAVVSGTTVYVFGYANAPEDPFAPHRSYVARVATSQVETASAWRFRYADGTWGTDMALAAPILHAQVSSTRLIGGSWYLAYKPWNGWGDTVFVERRASPWGTALATTTVSSPAGTTAGGRNYQTYAPQLHPEQALASGKVLLSIAWNGQTLGDIAADADLYKPRFHEVTLP
ncbi:hypothetical protein HPC49_40415 [Pyxidicoccus fallax]|uniref:DUF4185 domain-containing protein n=1 Tax=Pyxidicoccus fallax TaxID=394095 RepID=A0A848LV21_9BACT|nr:hypothetical protein [Pyxidicoccus fallax]NMO21918.1 DUF4185 domain-containing protein [Pyxidicoccus fallax]NPC84465.1 hypothetical protein [Pyxidicoccus fallax]